jgi:hypothetical protein
VADHAPAERTRQGFRIPDDIRAFMRKVVVKIDWSDESGSLVGVNAVVDDCVRGGRVDPEVYRFVYTPRDEPVRWTLTLREQQIRDIASGELREVDADREELAGPEGTAGGPVPHGEALLVWGEFGDDALRVRSPRELGVALDALKAAAEVPDAPQSFRLWSTSDDQLFAVVYGDQCAIYVVEGRDGYGTSSGDPTRTEAFGLVDQDAGSITIPWSDCVPWTAAKSALLRFADEGVLGPDVALDGRITPALLHLGELDRAAELETRPEPAADPARTSLMRINPFATWARRLVEHLRNMGLVELLDTALDRVIVDVAPLLHAHGEVALVSPRTAERVANEIGALRGVDQMYANGGDVQTALRRTKDP